MPAVLLPDRAVLLVTGADARKFLQNLVTCDVDALRGGDASFGALLTPQGKILFDFFTVCTTGLSFPTLGESQASGNPGDEDVLDSRSPLRGVGNDSGDTESETFLLDTDAHNAPALAKRLALYKLRARVAIAATDKRVIAVWADGAAPPGLVFRDPRANGMGARVVVDAASQAGDPAAYDAHRIACGVPKGGVDFAWGDAFPHEVNMDLLGGVSFDKGCYVGQEVVSRTQHRGTVRRRVLRATFEGNPPAPGSEIHAGEMLLGTVGSAAGSEGLVAVRTDRLADAQAAGLPIVAGGVPLHVRPLPIVTSKE